ncbi:hypothetical protein KA017_03300, partial [Candidatus Woesebacteria bacterium]|nr:hypothetical protein [Candidatus Woesebacteria bacterium]
MRPQEYNKNVTFVPAEPTYAENVTNTYNKLIKLVDQDSAQELIEAVRGEDAQINNPENFFKEAATILQNIDNKDEAKEVIKSLLEKYNKPTEEQIKSFDTISRYIDISVDFVDAAYIERRLKERKVTIYQAQELLNKYQERNFDTFSRYIDISVDFVDAAYIEKQLNKKE